VWKLLTNASVPSQRVGRALLSTSRSDAHGIPQLQARGTACEGPDKRQPPTLSLRLPPSVRPQSPLLSNVANNGMTCITTQRTRQRDGAIAGGCYCMCRYSLVRYWAPCGEPAAGRREGNSGTPGQLIKPGRSLLSCSLTRSTQQCRTLRLGRWAMSRGGLHRADHGWAKGWEIRVQSLNRVTGRLCGRAGLWPNRCDSWWWSAFRVTLRYHTLA
jgi:hypothetical protein